MKRILFIVALTCCMACNQESYNNPHVVINTSAGAIEVMLFEKEAPKSVAGFLRNIDSGYYQNASFYRVLNNDNQQSDAYKAELIQGGMWRTRRRTDMNIQPIPHETTGQTGLSHTNGTLSFARMEPGTATTEFFICIGDQKGFDFGGDNNPDKQGYAAFGRVVKGMDVVQTIYNRPEDDQYFIKPIYIYDIKKL